MKLLTLNFYILICLMISFFSANIFAQSKKPMLYQDGKPFTAAQFLEPIVDRYPRPKSWPSKLTFKTTSKSLEDVQRDIVGLWRMSLSCSGHAMTGSKLLEEKNKNVPSGIDEKRPFAMVEIFENNEFQDIYGGSIDDIHNQAEILSKVVRDKKDKYYIKLSLNGAFLFGNPESANEYLELTAIEIIETKEDAFLMTVPLEMRSSMDGMLCLPSDDIQLVLTPIPPLT